jgi:membrane protein DedA with SNARE-associated domain
MYKLASAQVRIEMQRSHLVFLCICCLAFYVNLTSGLMRYHLLHFSLWDITGEILWAALYVQIGRSFSDQLATISDVLGELTWVVLGVTAMVIIGYKLFQNFRQTPKPSFKLSSE